MDLTVAFMSMAIFLLFVLCISLSYQRHLLRRRIATLEKHNAEIWTAVMKYDLPPAPRQERG